MSIVARAKSLYARFRSFLFGTIDPVETEELSRRFVASYQHMFAAILYPASIYFAVMAVTYYIVDGPAGFFYIGLPSAIIAVACLAIRRELARRILTWGQLELRGVILFAMIFAALVSHHVYHLEPIKQIFFMFLALVTATASVSIRIVVGATVLCVATMLWFAAQASDEIIVQYLFVGFAAILVAIAMAILTRIAIGKEIHAGLVAERLHNEAEYLADHDMLTGLPNRRSYFRQLRDRIDMLAADGSGFALGIVDLDGFKNINDNFGHAVGDLVLAEVGTRLSQVCHEDCLVARIGGDEFGVLLPMPMSASGLRSAGGEILRVITQPYEVMDTELTISASIGFVQAGKAGLSENELLERADFAMFEAKMKKRGIIVFSQRHEKDLKKTREIDHALRHCDMDKEMSVVFQPQIDIRTGKTCGFEALARWESPVLGHVAAEDFIAAAERGGIIENMTPVLLAKALSGAAEWPAHIKLSFNLSIRDIMSAEAMQNVCRIVRESEMPPARVAFEVTETLIMADFEEACRSLAMLQKTGAHVALDDFGVGYANFAHIDQLKIDTIKVDRSFVARLDNRRATVKVLKTIIDMCANLGVDCIVEGVETEEQLAILRRIGAHLIQGNLFGKPLASGEIAAHLMRELHAELSGPPVSQARAR